MNLCIHKFIIVINIRQTSHENVMDATWGNMSKARSKRKFKSSSRCPSICTSTWDCWSVYLVSAMLIKIPYVAGLLGGHCSLSVWHYICHYLFPLYSLTLPDGLSNSVTFIAFQFRDFSFLPVHPGSLVGTVGCITRCKVVAALSWPHTYI